MMELTATYDGSTCTWEMVRHAAAHSPQSPHSRPTVAPHVSAQLRERPRMDPAPPSPHLPPPPLLPCHPTSSLSAHHSPHPCWRSHSHPAPSTLKTHHLLLCSSSAALHCTSGSALPPSAALRAVGCGMRGSMSHCPDTVDTPARPSWLYTAHGMDIGESALVRVAHAVRCRLCEPPTAATVSVGRQCVGYRGVARCIVRPQVSAARALMRSMASGGVCGVSGVVALRCCACMRVKLLFICGHCALCPAFQWLAWQSRLQ